MNRHIAEALERIKSEPVVYSRLWRCPVCWCENFPAIRICLHCGREVNKVALTPLECFDWQKSHSICLMDALEQGRVLAQRAFAPKILGRQDVEEGKHLRLHVKLGPTIAGMLLDEVHAAHRICLHLVPDAPAPPITTQVIKNCLHVQLEISDEMKALAYQAMFLPAPKHRHTRSGPMLFMHHMIQRIGTEIPGKPAT